MESSVTPGFAGIWGINWASAREPLKACDYWDWERDRIPEELLEGLMILERAYVRALAPKKDGSGRRRDAEGQVRAMFHEDASGGA